MRKTFLSLTAALLALLIGSVSCGGGKKADTPPPPPPIPTQQAPVNPEFEAYLANPSAYTYELPESPGRRTGDIPSPFKAPEAAAASAPLTQAEALVKADLASYPARYDMRELGLLSPVRDQGGYGTCWAHASLAAMESSARKAGLGGMDLSEWHLSWYAGNPLNALPPFAGSGTASLNSGGSPDRALGIMSRGPLAGAPVAEASAAYGSSTPPNPQAPSLLAVKRAGEPGLIYKDLDMVKGLVQTFGALYVSTDANFAPSNYRSDTFAYRSSNTPAGHAVNIVGWDDNFPRANFPSGNQPSGNGAWIVRNSWGMTQFGDNGYYYISYDTPLNRFAFFEADAETGKKVYQYDMHGQVNVTGYGRSTAWFSNIFAVAGSESVTDVAFYTITSNASYEITIRTGVGATPATGTVAGSPQTGTAELPGYHRIKLNAPANVSSGQKFAVIVKLTEKGCNYPISYSYAVRGYSDGATATKGVGFISPDGSTQWDDVTAALHSTASVCLKAFTQPAAVAVTGVALNKTTLALTVGASEALTATVAPSSATNKAVTWSTSNAAIATVNNGTVTGVAAGTATITATTQDGNRTATCAVTVTPVAVTGVSLNKTATTIAVGGTETLVATVAPSNAGNKGVTWTTSNAAIATVNNGTVTGVAAGTATITATTQDGNKTATCAVTVTPANVPVTGVTLDKASLALNVGASETLTATVEPSNATNKAINWSTSNASVATVSNGTVTAIAAGTATITVTTQDGNKTATCVVTVSVRPEDLGWRTNTWSGSSTFTVERNIFTINSNNREDDANFSRVFQVKPNTRYVFSADVTSTAGRSNETQNSTGANICVPSGYHNTAYDHNQGGWQTLELLVDSENNTEITLALRQGYFGSTVNGITQFKNIKLQERVVASRDSNWNFLCLVLRNCDVNITVDGSPRNVKITMDNAYVDAAKLQLNRFKTAIETMTNRQMTANLDIYVVDTPVTSLSDAGIGFWAGPQDIKQILKPYLESKSYDHVITMTQFDLLTMGQQIGAPRGWGGLNLGGPIGNLGYGKAYDIGYLQIPMSTWSGLEWYYDPNVPAQFYVSGLVHEFAHTAEWISNRKGIEVPNLHDGSNGYTENEDGLGEWYKYLRDYLTCNINSHDTPPRKIGCTQETYMLDRYTNVTIYELNELVA